MEYLVIGAGPAGLQLSYLLAGSGLSHRGSRRATGLVLHCVSTASAPHFHQQALHRVAGSRAQSALREFAGDLEPGRARTLYAVQGRGADALPTGRTTAAAWTKPCWYQGSTEDRAINPELQRFLAKRMKATTIELKAGHVSLISHPREIADVILAAAGRKA